MNDFFDGMQKSTNVLHVSQSVQSDNVPFSVSMTLHGCRRELKQTSKEATIDNHA
jgi:hypothetical protein